MKGDPEQRAIQLGEYIAAHRTTVRAAAAVFGCSKSERHLRGGAATRRKYSRK